MTQRYFTNMEAIMIEFDARISDDFGPYAYDNGKPSPRRVLRHRNPRSRNERWIGAKRQYDIEWDSLKGAFILEAMESGIDYTTTAFSRYVIDLIEQIIGADPAWTHRHDFYGRFNGERDYDYAHKEVERVSCRRNRHESSWWEFDSDEVSAEAQPASTPRHWSDDTLVSATRYQAIYEEWAGVYYIYENDGCPIEVASQPFRSQSLGGMWQHTNSGFKAVEDTVEGFIDAGEFLPHSLDHFLTHQDIDAIWYDWYQRKLKGVKRDYISAEKRQRRQIQGQATRNHNWHSFSSSIRKGNEKPLSEERFRELLQMSDAEKKWEIFVAKLDAARKKAEQTLTKLMS